MKKNEVIMRRIYQLIELAKENVKKHPERTKRYVSLALKLSMRHRFKLPKRLKRSLCKKCFTYWIPGYNLRIKFDKRKKNVKYICECGNSRIFKYK